MKPILVSPPIHTLAQAIAYTGAALALTFGIAACVPSPDSTPAPTPRPVAAVPAPVAIPSPVPTYDSWIDAPQTLGTWSYRPTSGGSVALFGPRESEARFTMECDRGAGRVLMSRAGAGASTAGMVIRSETASRALAAQPSGGQLVAAAVNARDPLLDAMALSKGRFAVENAGMPTLYLPAWAEVTRVIEDCR